MPSVPRSVVSFGLVVSLTMSACAGHSRDASQAAATTSPAASAAETTPQSATATVPAAAESPREVTVVASNRVAPRAANASDAWPPHLTPEPDEVPTPHLAHVSPAARSPVMAPPPWNEAAYRKDPQSYLDEPFPGRANQTAQPAADVAVLVADGPTGFLVAPLGRVSLRVRGEPWMPVTFTSFGLGAFLRTGLITVTVPADGDGLASATWVATTGTVGAVSIYAGSPVRAGQVPFLITVSE